MYTSLITLFLVVIIFSMLFMGNKIKNNLKLIVLRLRKKKFFHKTPFTQIRFYLKVLAPHPWCLSSYKRENYSKYPTFYSILNGIQFFGVIGSLLGMIAFELGDAKLSKVEKNGGLSAYVFLVDVKKPELAKNGKYYKSKLNVLFDNQENIVFRLERGIFQDGEVSFENISAQKDKKVLIEYFTDIMGIGYLVSLKSKEKIIIPSEISMSAYRDKEISRGFIIFMFLMGCITAFWKYKLYKFRKYFNRIK